MKQYIGKRVGYCLLSLFLLSVTIFLFVRVTGDPATLLVEPGASQADMDAIRHQFGLGGHGQTLKVVGEPQRAHAHACLVQLAGVETVSSVDGREQLLKPMTLPRRQRLGVQPLERRNIERCRHVSYSSVMGAGQSRCTMSAGMLMAAIGSFGRLLTQAMTSVPLAILVSPWCSRHA